MQSILFIKMKEQFYHSNNKLNNSLPMSDNKYNIIYNQCYGGIARQNVPLVKKVVQSLLSVPVWYRHMSQQNINACFICVNVLCWPVIYNLNFVESLMWKFRLIEIEYFLYVNTPNWLRISMSVIIMSLLLFYHVKFGISMSSTTGIKGFSY